MKKYNPKTFQYEDVDVTDALSAVEAPSEIDARIRELKTAREFLPGGNALSIAAFASVRDTLQPPTDNEPSWFGQLEEARTRGYERDDTVLASPTASMSDKAIAIANNTMRLFPLWEPTEFLSGESESFPSQVFHTTGMMAAAPIGIVGNAAQFTGALGERLGDIVGIPQGNWNPNTLLRKAGETALQVVEERSLAVPDHQEWASERMSQAKSVAEMWEIFKTDPVETIAGFGLSMAVPGTAMVQGLKGASGMQEIMKRVVGMGIGVGFPTNVNESLRETGDFDEALMRGAVKTSVEAFGNLATAGLAGKPVRDMLEKIPVLRGAITQALFTAAGGASTQVAAAWVGREMVNETLTPGQVASIFGTSMFDVNLLKAAAAGVGQKISKLHPAIDPLAFEGQTAPHLHAVTRHLDAQEAELRAMRRLAKFNTDFAAAATLTPQGRVDMDAFLSVLPVTQLRSGKGPTQPRTLRETDLTKGGVIAAFDFDWLNPTNIEGEIAAIKAVIESPGGNVPANLSKLEALQTTLVSHEFSRANMVGHIDRLRAIAGKIGDSLGVKTPIVITDALSGNSTTPTRILQGNVKGKPVTFINIRQSEFMMGVERPGDATVTPVFNYQKLTADVVGQLARDALDVNFRGLSDAAKAGLKSEYDRQMAIVAQRPGAAAAMNSSGKSTPPDFDTWLRDGLVRQLARTDKLGGVAFGDVVSSTVAKLRKEFKDAKLDLPFKSLANAILQGRTKRATPKMTEIPEPVEPTVTWAETLTRLTKDMDFMSRDLEEVAANRDLPEVERNALLDSLEQLGAFRTQTVRDKDTGRLEYQNLRVTPDELAPLFDQFRQFRQAEADYRSKFSLAEKAMDWLFTAKQSPDDRLSLSTNRYGWGETSARVLATMAARSQRLSWAHQWFRNIPQVRNHRDWSRAEVTESHRWMHDATPVSQELARVSPGALKAMADVAFAANGANKHVTEVIAEMQAAGVPAEATTAYLNMQRTFRQYQTEQYIQEQLVLERREKLGQTNTEELKRQKTALRQKYEGLKPRAATATQPATPGRPGLLDASFIPEKRFGDFYASIPRTRVNKEGDVVPDRPALYAFESQKELDAFLAEQIARGTNPSSFHLTGRERAINDMLTAMPLAVYEDLKVFLQKEIGITDAADPRMKRLDDLAHSHSSDSRFTQSLSSAGGVPGYSRDITRIFNSHAANFARHIANTKYGAKIGQNLESLAFAIELEGQKNTGTLAEHSARNVELARLRVAAKWMKDHREEAFNAHNDLNKMAGFFFFKSLAFDLPNTIATLNQIPTVVVPRLSHLFGDVPEVWKTLGGAMKDITTKFGRAVSPNITAREQAHMTNLTRSGKLTETSAREILNNVQRDFEGDARTREAALRGELGPALRVAGRAGIEGTYKALTFPMHATETGVRQATALAAIRLAIRTGMPDERIPAFVTQLLTDTTLDYHRINRPLMYANQGGAGYLKQFLGLFRTYVENTAFQVLRPTNVAKSIPMLVLLGGVKAIPGIQDAAAVADIVNGLGDDVDDQSGPSENNALLSLRLAVTEATNGRAADFVMNGMSREGYGIPAMLRDLGMDVPDVDLSGVSQLGSMFPARAPEVLRNAYLADTDEFRAASSLAGAPGAYMRSIVEMGGNALSGKPMGKSVENLLPDVLKNYLRGSRRLEEGLERDQGGKEISGYRTPEEQSYAKATQWGFSSTDEARKFEEFTLQSEHRIRWEAQREYLISMFHRAMDSGNTQGQPDATRVQVVMDMIDDFNKNPHTPPGVYIKPEGLRQGLKQRKQELAMREAGYIRDTPPNAELKRSYSIK